jgi:hypothetical protein
LKKVAYLPQAVVVADDVPIAGMESPALPLQQFLLLKGQPHVGVAPCELLPTTTNTA